MVSANEFTGIRSSSIAGARKRRSQIARQLRRQSGFVEPTTPRVGAFVKVRPHGSAAPRRSACGQAQTLLAGVNKTLVVELRTAIVAVADYPKNLASLRDLKLEPVKYAIASGSL